MSRDHRVAIVGIGGIWPDAPDLDRFWSNIAAGVASAGEVPPGRWRLDPRDAYAPEVAAPDRVYSTRGCFVAESRVDPEGFDAGPLADWDRLDPVFHLSLQAARAAWRDARTEGVDPGRVGVVFGNLVLPTETASDIAEAVLGRAFAEAAGYEWAGCPAVEPLNARPAGSPAGLVARALGLGGGAYTLDAACASSLYAVKLAADALLAGTLDAAICGGVSRPDPLYTQMGFAQLRALSPSGVASPFGAAADGLVVGEGAGMVVLKRLADAVAQGDHIYGVLVGSGVSNDIDGNLLAPSSEGQLRAMRAAYAQAGWRPDAVDLIECHATGTPVGDAVEFASYQALWAEAGADATPERCVLGSIKSNIGHCLTAAGASGLLKLLLAIRAEALPPTAGFAGPAPKIDLAGSPFRILAEAESWPRRDDRTPRRAAISGFGFGGINAHLLIEEWLPGVSPAPAAEPEDAHDPGEPIAVVALAARFGPFDSTRAVAERLLGGRAEVGPIAPDPGSTWGIQSPAGYRIDAVALPADRFRIPPKELAESLPQQLLLLLLADEATRAAGWAGDRSRPRTGAIVGLGLDPNSSNYHVRWRLLDQARGWNERYGLGLDEAGLAAWVAELRDAFGPPLTANRVMGNLGSIVASRVAREFRLGGPSFTVSAEETSGPRALDVACGLLRRGEIDEAIVGAVDLATDPRLAWANAAFRPASGSPHVPGDGAAVLIVKRLADAEAEGDPIRAVIRDSESVTWDVGLEHLRLDQFPSVDSGGEAIEPAVGDVGAASGAAGLVLSMIAVEVAIEPARSPGFGAQPAAFWIHDRVGPPREAMVRTEGMGPDGSVALTLIEEYKPTATGPGDPAAPSPLGDRPAGLFAWSGADRGALLAGLDRLAALAAAHPKLAVEPLARSWFGAEGYDPTAQRAGAIVASDRADLARQVAAARRRLRAEPGSTDAIEWPGEAVALSDEPMGPDGGLAFVFPPMGNGFAGMGREVAVHWPHVLRRQDGENKRLGDQMSGVRWDKDVPWRFHDHREPIFGQVAVGTMVADLLRSFGVRPTAAIGYSLGESTALLALRAWPDRDGLYAKFSGSSLFGTDLAGPCDAARRTWNLPDDEAADWVAAVVPVGRDEAEAALLGEERAYLLLVNTDEEVVIGGQAAVVGRVVGRLGGRSTPLPMVSTVHCPVVRAVSGAYRDLHSLPVDPPDGITWYSGASGAPYALSSESAADAILAQASGTVDFPRLIRRAYADGVRLFVEIGPGASCTRLIGSILADRPHRAVVACPSDREPVAAVLLVLARLVAERFPVDLASLYGTGPIAEGPPLDPRRSVRVATGGAPFRPPAPPPGRADLIDDIGYDPVELPGPLDRRNEPNLVPAAMSHEVDEVGAAMRNEAMISRPAASVGTNVAVPTQNEPNGWHPPASPGTSGFVMPAGRNEANGWHHSPAGGADGIGGVARNEANEPMPLGLDPVVGGWLASREAGAGAHSAFLGGSASLGDVMARTIARQMELIGLLGSHGEPSGTIGGGPSWHGFGAPTPWPEPEAIDWPDPSQTARGRGTEPVPPGEQETVPSNDRDFEPPLTVPRSLDREACLRFAVGRIGDVLGPEFAAIDAHPTRVRLPDEPLMLVDRITSIEGEPRSMGSGRVVTEHDIHEGAWYLDAGVIPTCIAVESGQADLFLGAFLGIDFETEGLAVYRLLDAVVSFDRALPAPGQTIVYDIHIDRFFRQGDARLFRFRFTATVDGEPLMTMSDGIAGFFTAEALAAGQGVVKTALDLRPVAGVRPDDWTGLVPMGREALDDHQVEALRAGDLVGAFGGRFAGVDLAQPAPLPGGLMRLVDRVTMIDPAGGRYGLGLIRAEADIDPDAWFMTCHFVDDQVMPGTLMFECCLHTLRIYLMRMGWIGEAGEVACHPVPGVASRLKCRGQVVASTQKVTYEVEIRELGFRPEPYAIVDALMYADGKPIVEITAMSLRMEGLDRGRLEEIWAGAGGGVTPESPGHPAPLYDAASIRAFAVGNPSEAFGDRYRVFDSERVIARLPGPPYQFLDRVIEVGGEPWVMAPGARAVAEYDVPPDAWYFDADRGDLMPFAVLLEAALQPCGWLAAYMGSALTSEVDLSFRNLGGSAVQHEPVGRDVGTLRTEVAATRVSSSGGMIIQSYSIEMTAGGRPIYTGETTFGFFSKAALANQVGIREARPYEPTADEAARAESFACPAGAPFPDDSWRMIDRVDAFVPDGGPHGLGWIRGSLMVDPSAWFFQAHFYQDPVVPGSLGLESLVQLLKVVAEARWGSGPDARFEAVAVGEPHRWVYRGQILPGDSTVTTRVVVTAIDDARRLIRADGFLDVDGRVIYGMTDFTLRCF